MDFTNELLVCLHYLFLLAKAVCLGSAIMWTLALITQMMAMLGTAIQRGSYTISFQQHFKPAFWWGLFYILTIIK